jgi:hypothetical protein
MASSNAINVLKKEEDKFKLSPKELIFKYMIYLPLIVTSVVFP